MHDGWSKPEAGGRPSTGTQAGVVTHLFLPARQQNLAFLPLPQGHDPYGEYGQFLSKSCWPGTLGQNTTRTSLGVRRATCRALVADSTLGFRYGRRYHAIGMTDPTGRFFGQCVVDTEDPVLDVGALVERLLVFDAIVLHSVRLTEIDGLVRTFGPAGTKSLIESRVLEIHAEALAMGAREGSRLPSGSFEIVTARVADRKANASQWLQRIMAIPGLDYREARKLKSVVGTHLRHAPENAGMETRAETSIDIDNRPELARFALAISLSEELDRSIDAREVEISFERDGSVYSGRSNLVERFGVMKPMRGEHSLPS